MQNEDMAHDEMREAEREGRIGDEAEAENADAGNAGRNAGGNVGKVVNTTVLLHIAADCIDGILTYAHSTDGVSKESDEEFCKGLEYVCDVLHMHGEAYLTNSIWAHGNTYMPNWSDELRAEYLNITRNSLRTGLECVMNNVYRSITTYYSRSRISTEEVQSIRQEIVDMADRFDSELKKIMDRIAEETYSDDGGVRDVHTDDV